MNATRTTLFLRTILSGTLVLLLAGCKSIGPGSVTRDRSDYSSSIADSWKQQTLLNIVKLRYLDLPVFVDVASVVSGYSLQTGISAGGSFPQTDAFGGNTATVGGSAIYTDRPTVTYTPMTGQKFLRGMLTPIDPKNIFFLLQSGYSADFVLALTVESLNGLHNRSGTAGSLREAEPDFIRVLELMREVQMAGAVSVRVMESKDKSSTTVLFFRRENLPPETIAKLEEIRRLLKLAPDRQQFSLVYSPVSGGPDELAVGSRSVLQIMMAFASYAEVPEKDLTEGRATPGAAGTAAEQARTPVRIKCSQEKPADAFAAVEYRKHWFWIDDRDWRSKRAFTAIMFIFTMTDSAGEEKLPLITIPAQ